MIAKPVDLAAARERAGCQHYAAAELTRAMADEIEALRGALKVLCDVGNSSHEAAHGAFVKKVRALLPPS